MVYATPEISPPPPDRNYDSVNVRELLKHLQTDGALTCDNVLVVERVNEGVALLIAELESLRVGVVVNALYQADLCAVGLGSLYLRDRRAVGQADERLDTGSGSRESNALRVVSCGAGDNALCLLLVAELGDLEIRAAHLERTSYLEVLGLEIDLGLLVDLGSLDEVGLPDDFLENV